MRFIKHNHMLRSLFLLLALLLSLGASMLGFAQTKKELEKKKVQLRKDIEITNKILEETRKNKSVSLNQLVALNKKIGMRQELISTITRESLILQYQVDQTNASIATLEQEMKELKEEYAKMIYFAYKNQSAYQRLMFIFASSDFNKAYKRLRYMQQYSDYRKQQKANIEKTQLELTKQREELISQKQAKMDLLMNLEGEKKQLTVEKTEQVEVVNTLQQKEQQLKAQLREKQRAEEKLNKAIEDIIRKEIDDARKKAEKEGRPVAKTGGFALTPEAQKLSDGFASNMGKLPWPVEQGVITETFGVHPHPVLKGIETNNNGIDIGTKTGANARAIFDGEVSGVIVIPGSGKAVLVRHGEYLSVYSNLDDVFVKSGQKVSTKQSLGSIRNNEEDSKTEMNLQIWKGTIKMNPEIWLYRVNK